ncbi:hypothetical protein DFH09DRAFT_942845 [Mycena vulgaris]|nr:hypothetical protein DFH09DRAFT_942845 [Mycena vulgaris]
MVGKRRYQHALDDLEALIVARLMELAKCNLAGTGMWKHIAKALQVRSKAIKASIKRYNAAARSMIPPRIHVLWDEVVDYTFLADFDLLREGWRDIREEPWALLSGASP